MSKGNDGINKFRIKFVTCWRYYKEVFFFLIHDRHAICMIVCDSFQSYVCMHRMMLIPSQISSDFSLCWTIFPYYSAFVMTTLHLKTQKLVIIKKTVWMKRKNRAMRELNTSFAYFSRYFFTCNISWSRKETSNAISQLVVDNSNYWCEMIKIYGCMCKWARLHYICNLILS